LITLTVDNEIEIDGLSESEKTDIRNWFVILNPKFDIASRMNKSLWGIQPKLKYYREDGGKMIVPVGTLSMLKGVFPKASIVDNRYTSKDELKNLDFTGTLRDYQVDAVKAMEKEPNGVLCCLTGGGKTIIMTKMICDLKQPTLILVHTIELANQFLSALLQFTNLKKTDIGRLGDGKQDIKPITVGLLQSVVSMDNTFLRDNFGAVFVDEVHIAPAETYADALSKINAKHKYGASSTPERADGLTRVIFWLTGELRHTVPTSALANVIIKPEIQVIETEFYFPLFDSSEYQAMITDLSRDTARNKLIVNAVKNFPSQQIAILCQRKEQVDLLQNALPGSVILTSDMGKKARVSVMKGLLNGTYRVVISTYQLFSTGLDIPTLEVLFMAAPIKSVVKVRQSAGRLMRTTALLPNKKPIIVDFADKKVELLKHQWYQRSRILRTL
jgi:superfamily II DNA or RNA helicase